MQTAIVLLIVAAAVFFLARRFYHSIAKENSSICGCSCSGCHSIQSCTDFENAPKKESDPPGR